MADPLIEKILPLFLSEGISSLTIQDLARQMNISTKTLYKKCGNKENLLTSCLEYYYLGFLDQIKSIYNKNTKALWAFLTATDYILEQEFKINNLFFSDLNQNFKDIQDKVLESINPKFPDLSIAILKKGITEGSIEQEIIPEIFLIAYGRVYHSITRERAYLDYNDQSAIVLKSALYPIIKGILTPLGLKEYEEYLSEKSINKPK